MQVQPKEAFSLQAKSQDNPYDTMAKGRVPSPPILEIKTLTLPELPITTIWPIANQGAISLAAAQLSMLLEGIDWSAPKRTWQPRVAL